MVMLLHFTSTALSQRASCGKCRSILTQTAVSPSISPAPSAIITVPVAPAGNNPGGSVASVFFSRTRCPTRIQSNGRSNGIGPKSNFLCQGQYSGVQAWAKRKSHWAQAIGR
jgi:hypothetical protein